MAYYKLHEPSRNFLMKHGFRYSQLYSDMEYSAFVKKFPLYKWNDYITVECRMIAFLETGELRVDVLDSGTKGYYASWYIQDKPHEKSLKEMNAKIDKELKKLKVEKMEK